MNEADAVDALAHLGLFPVPLISVVVATIVIWILRLHSVNRYATDTVVASMQIRWLDTLTLWFTPRFSLTHLRCEFIHWIVSLSSSSHDDLVVCVIRWHLQSLSTSCRARPIDCHLPWRWFHACYSINDVGLLVILSRQSGTRLISRLIWSYRRILILSLLVFEVLRYVQGRRSVVIPGSGGCATSLSIDGVDTGSAVLWGTYLLVACRRLCL